jgi:hypothetical protein
MIELLGFLEEQGFSNYIASGGGRDFMRPVSGEAYGIPSERVIGSSVGLVYTPDDHGGTVTREAATDYLDDGPHKPVRIWSRTGRRPLLAAGRSNGYIEMLRYTQHPDKPTLRLLIQHDDLTVSSTTGRAPRRLWTRQPRAGGPSSASRTTARQCSDRHTPRHGSALLQPVIGGDAVRGWDCRESV